MRNLRLAACSLAVAALFGGAVAGCGDDDDDSGDEATVEETTTEEAASVEEVTLIADEAGAGYTFELSATPTAETTSIVFDNQGAEGHALIYARINEGFTVDEAFELEGRQGSADVLIEDGAAPGQSKTIEIADPIEPGSYAMLCPIGTPEGAHYELGQLEEFEIE